VSAQPQAVGLVVAGLLFVAFLLFKLLAHRLPMGGDDRARASRRELSEAKRLSRNRNRSPAERATALRAAALTALDGLGRPGLAASYARRAERLDPSAAESVGLLARALRRGSRYRALERLLWRRIARGGVDEGYHKAFAELLALYEGPLRRPEVVEALRRLRSDPDTRT
jgi:hypothetical protein